MKVTLLKNFLGMLVAVLVVLGFFWAVSAPPADIIAGLNMAVPVVAFTLITDDALAKLFVRKRLRAMRKMAPDERTSYLADHEYDRDLIDRLSGRYWFGLALMSSAILAFVWASTSTTGWETVGRLGAMLFLSAMGLVWMFFFYKPGVQTDKEREVEQWDKAKKRLRKASTEEDCLAIIGPVLRHYPHNDTIWGSLDFSRPVALNAGECLTYLELGKLTKNGTDVEDQLTAVEKELHAFIKGMHRKG